MKKHTVIITAVLILGLCNSSYSLTTECIGPSRRNPAEARPDWPAGIIEIPRHVSRVYSTSGGFGNDDFYFKATVGQINELLTLFSKTRIRDHVVRIEPGVKKTSTFFSKEEIEYNVHLGIVSGVALILVRGDSARKALPVEPELTIFTGDDNSLIKKLKWPRNLIVESKIRGVSVNKDKKRPKRYAYYGLCEFTGGPSAVKFVNGLNIRITLWEQDEPNGIGIGRVDNDRYLRILLSDAELADLRKGKTWLTITVGGWMVKAKKGDTRLLIEMLTKDRDKARPIRIEVPPPGILRNDQATTSTEHNGEREQQVSR